MRSTMRPELRFRDVWPIWEAAQRAGGCRFRCDSRNKAIGKLHRLNMARRVARDELGLGAHIWDAFAGRIGEVAEDGSCDVIIAPRDPFQAERLIGLDGRPLPKEGYDAEAPLGLEDQP